MKYRAGRGPVEILMHSVDLAVLWSGIRCESHLRGLEHEPSGDIEQCKLMFRPAIGDRIRDSAAPNATVQSYVRSRMAYKRAACPRARMDPASCSFPKIEALKQTWGQQIRLVRTLRLQASTDAAFGSRIRVACLARVDSTVRASLRCAVEGHPLFAADHCNTPGATTELTTAQKLVAFRVGFQF
eukprot:4300500-Prymnesium_polylepis.2